MTDSQSPGAADPAAQYSRAIALCKANRPAEAEPLLRSLVTSYPTNADAVQLLGIAVSTQGRVAESLQWFDRAIALRPGHPGLVHNRAQTLFKLGRLAEARAGAEEALRLQTDYGPALNLLGNVLAALGDREGAEHLYRRTAGQQGAGVPQQQHAFYNLALSHHEAGRLDEAIAGYRQALASGPPFAEAHVNLANALKMKGRDDEAYAHYAEALRIDPEFPDALTNYGTVLREAGRVQEAIPLLEKAARKRPDSEYVQNNLGIAYFETNRFEESLECYRRALAIRPGFHKARNNLGNALSALGRNDEAEREYRAVIAALPDEAYAHSNLGILLQERGAIDEAMAHYERALAIRPDFPDAINNMGYLLQERGRRRDAMELYRRALEANPNYARGAYNLALAHLCEFEFAQGWKLHEVRYRTVPPIAVPRAFDVPAFSADDLGKGLPLAIWREQGVGDQLLYSTMLPDLEAQGQPFVLEMDLRLIAAFKRAHPTWKVVSPEESTAAFADCQRHSAMGTLAGILRPSLASFDHQPKALLAADPERAGEFRARLAAPRTRVAGISWRSFQPAVRGFVTRKKSAPLESFKALSRRGDLRLLDLQYGDTAAERAVFAQAGGRLTNLDGLDLFKDLDGVMAAIEACDVVVTTSNVTAHLAGAIGKRTLLVYLSANPPFHYWATDETGRCLWYPSVRIVTGPDLDTWDKAFARVDELLDA